MIKKNFPTFGTVISTFILIYIFYKSEIFYNGEKRDYYVTYYILSLITLIFFISIYFVGDKIRTYLIIIFVSFFISFYSFEVFITFIYDHELNKIRTYKKITGKEFELRSKLEVFNDLKKYEKKIKLITPPNRIWDYQNEDIFPLSGISNSKTINCNENGFYSSYISDRYGFNNPDSEWDSKLVEYVIIGDSFAHGSCVNRPTDVASVIRHLSNKSVLNLGYGGTGPLTQYATLREYLKKDVKKILLLYYEGNDISNLKTEMQNQTLIKYLDDQNYSQNLITKQKTIDKLLNQHLLTAEVIADDKIEEISLQSKIIKIIKLSNTRGKLNLLLNKKNKPHFSSSDELQLGDFAKLVKLILEISNRNNAEFYFVYLPEFARYVLNYDQESYFRVKSILKELNIPLIDIHEELFSKQNDPLTFFPFRSDGHYTVEGYEKLGQIIYKFTNKN
tara:strand:- start:448 stop:1791 length:1344 start_codon:yes stop_codon:yes gene_type:complete